MPALPAQPTLPVPQRARHKGQGAEGKSKGQRAARRVVEGESRRQGAGDEFATELNKLYPALPSPAIPCPALPCLPSLPCLPCLPHLSIGARGAGDRRGRDHGAMGKRPGPSTRKTYVFIYACISLCAINEDVHMIFNYASPNHRCPNIISTWLCRSSMPAWQVHCLQHFQICPRLAMAT